MVLYAVLAVSSRHQAILSGSTDEVEASTFHGRCLELLISALSQPEETWDDNLLATVVILRIYEELDNRNDKKCHIVGSSRLLNTVSKFSSSGGLAEAASWLFLRQAIYVSLVHRVPLELNLDNYERSSVFDRFDNESYANVIIFLFARALQLIYPVRRDVAVGMHAWDLLQESIDRWYSSKPSSFAPFHYRDASMEESRPFPELWMISPAAGASPQAPPPPPKLFLQLSPLLTNEYSSRTAVLPRSKHPDDDTQAASSVAGGIPSRATHAH